MALFICHIVNLFQVCLNTPGSFMCGCEEGYVQKLDKCIKRKSKCFKHRKVSLLNYGKVNIE